MRKRVLLAEPTDSVRGMAEQILRQGGYEVIAVSEADRMLEVIQLSRPDLLVVSAGLSGQDKQPIYATLPDNPHASGIPVLVIGTADGAPAALPEEQVVLQPLDPQQFRLKVSEAFGRSTPQATPESPVSADLRVDDDFLDAALGLDHISVTDSEVMDQTVVGQKAKPSSPEKMIGFDHYVNEDSELSDSSRVESLIVNEDTTNIVNRVSKKRPQLDVSESQKLELADDQYNLAQLGSAGRGGDAQSADHDYNWFINAMREDVAGVETPAPDSKKQKTEPAGNDSGELSVAQPSESVNPITAVPTQNEHKADGVDKFIDEFKKEMEVLRSHEPESVVLQETTDQTGASGKHLRWEERLERMTTEELGIFTRQFAEELAERIAVKIVARIDPEKLLNLLKSEILNRVNKKLD